MNSKSIAEIFLGPELFAMLGRECGVKDCQEKAIDEQELDVAGNKVWLCEQHLVSYEKYWEADIEARPSGN